MNAQPCSETDCEKPVQTRKVGLCAMHYQRLRRYGNPAGSAKATKAARSMLERIGELVQVQDNGCWLWQGPIGAKGYGRSNLRGKQESAHRMVYEELVGPIPGDDSLDHICRVKSCVNPQHLQPVSLAENLRRISLTPEEHLSIPRERVQITLTITSDSELGNRLLDLLERLS